MGADILILPSSNTVQTVSMLQCDRGDERYCKEVERWMFFLNINGHFKRLEKLNQRNCRTITGERFEAKVSCMYLTEKELSELYSIPAFCHT